MCNRANLYCCSILEVKYASLLKSHINKIMSNHS